MKKILSVLMALGMTFSLAACAGSTPSSSEAASDVCVCLLCRRVRGCFF